MKYKLLFVHDYLGLKGGAEHFILQIAKSLKSSFSLSFLYREYTGVGRELFEDVFDEILQDIPKEKPDLIFIHKCLEIKMFESLFSLSAPLVHMVHDHEGYCLKGSKTFPLTKGICTYKAGLCCLFPGLAFIERNKQGNLSFSWKNPCEKRKLVNLDYGCDLFLTASDYMRQTLIIQGYSPEKIQTLFGVPPSSAVASPSFGEENILLFSGQLVRGKGVEELLKSLKLVKVPYRLEIFGDGPEKARLAELAKDMPVTFHGFVPQSAYLPYINQATAALFPSIWPEPFGMAGVEWMQHGLPVVGFDAGGVSEWLKDGKSGFLVPRLGIQEMADKIILLLQDKNLARKLGRQAKAFVETAFDFDTFTHQLELTFKNRIEKDSHGS